MSSWFGVLICLSLILHTLTSTFTQKVIKKISSFQKLTSYQTVAFYPFVKTKDAMNKITNFAQEKPISERRARKKREISGAAIFVFY